MLPGRFLGSGDTLALTINGAASPIHADTRAAGVTAAEQAIWLCVRPEQIEIEAAAASGSDQAALNGRLLDLIFQGTTMLLEIHVDGLGTIRAECPPGKVKHLNAGDAVVLHLSGGHIVPRDAAETSSLAA